MSLGALLESYGLAEKYAVEQADAMRLRCRGCGDTVSADVLDLHERECDGEVA